jgi:hypothetical protein
MTVYSDHKWTPWLFNSVSKGFFEVRNNRRDYIEWIMRKENLKSFSELQTEHFRKNKGLGLLDIYSGSIQAIVDSLSDNDSEKVQKSSKGRDAIQGLKAKKPQKYWVQSLFAVFTKNSFENPKTFFTLKILSILP